MAVVAKHKFDEMFLKKKILLCTLYSLILICVFSENQPSKEDVRYKVVLIAYNTTWLLRRNEYMVKDNI